MNIKQYLTQNITEYIDDKKLKGQMLGYINEYLQVVPDLKNNDFVNMLEDKFSEFENEFFSKIVNNTKYLITLDNLMVEKHIKDLSESNFYKNDVMFKLQLEQIAHIHHNKSATNYYLFENIFKLASNPQYIIDENIRSISEQSKIFYFENEENILLYRILKETFNSIDQFCVRNVEGDIVDYILSDQKDRKTIINKLNGYRNSNKIVEMINIINHFAEKSFKLTETTNQFVSNVYSFTKDVSEYEYLFATKTSLYNVNLKERKIEKIDSHDIIRMNESLFHLNNMINPASPNVFRFQLGEYILEMKHDEDTLDTVYSYNNQPITEEQFPIWINKMSSVVRSNDFQTIWILHENMRRFRRLNFVTSIKNATTGIYNNVNIFNLDETFGIEVNTPTGTKFANNLNTVALCNTVFEHTGIDITESVKDLLTAEKSIINEIRNKINILENELQTLRNQHDKVDNALNTGQVAKEFIDEITKLRENLESQIDDKVNEMSQLELKATIKETETIDSVNEEENEELNEGLNSVNKKTVSTIAKQEFAADEAPNAGKNQFVPNYALKKLPGSDTEKVKNMYRVKSRDKIKDETSGEYGIVDWIRSTGPGCICATMANGRQKLYTFDDIGKKFKVLKSNFDIYAADKPAEREEIEDKSSQKSDDLSTMDKQPVDVRMSENTGNAEVPLDDNDTIAHVETPEKGVADETTTPTQDVETQINDTISETPKYEVNDVINYQNAQVKQQEQKIDTLQSPVVGDYVRCKNKNIQAQILVVGTDVVHIAPKNEPQKAIVVDINDWNLTNFEYIGKLSEGEMNETKDDKAGIKKVVQPNKTKGGQSVVDTEKGDGDNDADDVSKKNAESKIDLGIKPGETLINNDAELFKITSIDSSTGEITTDTGLVIQKDDLGISYFKSDKDKETDNEKAELNKPKEIKKPKKEDEEE